MALGKLAIKSTDVHNNSVVENLGYVSLNIFEGAAGRGQNAQTIDTFARAVNYLTTNTYNDSIVTYDYSINEVIAEEE